MFEKFYVLFDSAAKAVTADEACELMSLTVFTVFICALYVNLLSRRIRRKSKNYFKCITVIAAIMSAMFLFGTEIASERELRERGVALCFYLLCYISEYYVLKLLSKCFVSVTNDEKDELERIIDMNMAAFDEKEFELKEKRQRVAKIGEIPIRKTETVKMEKQTASIDKSVDSGFVKGLIKNALQKDLNIFERQRLVEMEKRLDEYSTKKSESSLKQALNDDFIFLFQIVEREKIS